MLQVCPFVENCDYNGAYASLTWHGIQCCQLLETETAEKDNSCQWAMRKTMEHHRLLRSCKKARGYQRLEDNNNNKKKKKHLWGRPSDRQSTVMIIHTSYHEKKELHIFPPVTRAALWVQAAANLLTVLRNWISSSPSPPSAMAAKEPVQKPPLAPLPCRY